ncbi:M14 family metallopeptidase [Luteimonas sp. S4-F44]|uniref:M14 family metallopeptidase n=1 Tax=Luteimonas sp. S4-F44 TaxID=2925842 RepID=UPI001F534911|nr:M14 family metallopeptidase [Luteimonas sp. S4-F44]UNK41147.1 M14 family metallopeptidase [Luteimonas sp. S4-F44]
MFRRPLLPLLLAAALAVPLSSTAKTDDPRITVSERSGFIETGRYDEVVRLCATFARLHPDAVRCTQFGTTPEGRPMQALIVSRSGILDPAQARAQGIPVVLIQGGIHAGEIDGKDAGFLALRQVLDGDAAPGALDALVWVFVPVFSADGHERFAAWNRPNQRGPREMGWRTTAQNYNLNRDYAKADAPEMQAMLALVEAWDPIAYVDLHATNGAQFEHDIAVQVEPVHSGDAQMRNAGRAFRDAVIDDLARQGALPLPYYPSFVESDNPASGFEDGVSPPRFSTGYFPLRNRVAMLIETHSWKPYPVRVALTRNTVISVLEQIARHGRDWRRVAADADTRAAALGGTPLPLDWQATPRARMVDFRGYAYTRTRSEVSGALMTRYDETTPQIWRVPLRDEIVPSLTVTLPRAGYIVPAAHATSVAQALDRHGITYSTLTRAHPQLAVDTFRAERTAFGTAPVEGHQRLTLEGRWRAEPQDIGAGALYVPIAQPKARLVAALLEPQAPDSMAAWGRFNTHFERKEYMEDYVAEAVAREMLAADPALAEDFRTRLRDDPAFAADPNARLTYFYRRHSAWDARYNLYPVVRTDVAPE